VVHRLRRRWVLTLGGFAYVAACGLYATGTPLTLVLGLLVFVAGTAVIESTLNLFVLDHIPRRALPQFEPKRMFFSAVTFSAGPWVGVQLHYNVANDLAFLAAGISAASFCAFFWYLRLKDDPAVTSPLRPAPNPVRYLARFFAQPRLVLAWILALGRNGWWLMFVVYAPIYATELGYSPQTGGLIVSIGILPMLLMPLWAKVSARYGIRVLLIAGYTIAAILSCAAGLATGDPVISLALLCASAFGATLVDGAGNVPFLRAVHPYERSEMTSVFMTYRHGSNLAAPGLFAGVLSFFALPAIFVTGGLWLLGMSILSRAIPKRM